MLMRVKSLAEGN